MLFNAIMLALREIRRNVLRSTLTMLGIVIGVASVVALVTLGGGATASVTADIANLGRNLVVVTPGAARAPGQPAAAIPFREEDARAMAREVPGIAGIAAVSMSSELAVVANRNWTTTVIGTDTGYFDVRIWPTEIGRPFDATEVRAGKSLCVIGRTIRRELFGRQDPLGAQVRIGRMSCQVVGVLSAKGQSTFGQDQDDLILMPLTTFQRRISGNQDINVILISAATAEATGAVVERATALLRERRHLLANEANDFQVQDIEEISKTVEQVTGVLTALLGAIAAISLLVGGIGIMNIMLVSVTERTREIGTRLAIGALEREVLAQFLIESAALSSIGGLAGAALGLGGSYLGARPLGIPFVFEPTIVIVALLFAALVGIAFGYLPARRAARMDPIEALRHE
ncbi:MAG: ABC transporter permease [Alphaproteobacteria bacterium]